MLQTQSATISPYGPSVSGKSAGTDGSPLQFDSSTYTINGQAGQCWWLVFVVTADASDSEIYNRIYNTLTTNRL